MATRVTWSILKGITSADAAALLDTALAAQPGPAPRRSAWSDDRNATAVSTHAAIHEGDTLVLASECYVVACHIAASTGCPHMELRIQEGDHWDFTLTQRGQTIADFSTRVSAFDDDLAAPRPWKQGSLKDFLAVWKCEQADVEPYLIDWDRLRDPTWARQGDECATGNCFQALDFMRALGVIDPLGHPARREIRVVGWTTEYHPQPRWRRIVRRLSVWFKGTYPDVPRQTREQKEVWRKRKASLHVVRSDGKKIYPFRK